MFTVNFGPFAWLDAAGLVTTAGASAQRYPDAEAARLAAVGADGDRGAAVAKQSGSRWLAYLMHGCTVEVVPAALLDARMARLHPVKRDGEAPAAAAREAALKPEPGPRLTKSGKPAAGGEGVTARIRVWTVANPEATKADALAAFPEANPSTVSVQFYAARRGA